MAENEQVSRLEPSRADRFGDVREAGRRGGMQKEANWQARVAESREMLMQLAPEAIEAIADIIRGERRPTVLPAAVAVLDRTGAGPTTKTELSVGPSERLVELINRLDAEPQEPTSDHRTLEDAASGPYKATSTPTHRLELTVDSTPESAVSDDKS